MNFQAYLEDTYRIIKEEPVVIILGGLLVQLLTVFSLGLLAGPIVGGYTLLVILYLRENRKPVFNDIFSGLQEFSRLFPYFLVLLLIFFGFMLLILPGFLFATWWLYVLPLMVDKKMSFTDAMRLSMNKVNETGFLMHLVFLLLISVIPMMLIDFVSTLLPLLIVLKIFLPPLQVGCLASLYIDQFKQEEAPADSTADGEPAAEPAAPSLLKTNENLKAVENDEKKETSEPEATEISTDGEKTQNDSVDEDNEEEKN
jgi:hypothetical protein